jgi:hypothetical protein
MNFIRGSLLRDGDEELLAGAESVHVRTGVGGLELLEGELAGAALGFLVVVVGLEDFQRGLVFLDEVKNAGVGNS